MKYISKISGGRVCIYLSDNKLMEKMVNNSVKVKEQILTVRLLMEKNKRVVISDVSPTIPNELLLNLIKSEGITLRKMS